MLTALAILLSACGGAATPAAETTAAAAAATTTAAGTTAAEATTAEAAEAAETTTAAAAAATTTAASAEKAAPQEPSGELVEIEVFLDHTWYPTDKFEGIIPEAITAATGVVFVPTRAADEQQRGLMIAADDLPEMIFTSGDLNRLSNPALCHSYTDLIKDYTPDWQPAGDAIVNSSSYSQDGKYYFLFSHGFTAEEWANAKIGVPMVYSAYYRSDLAQQVGITEFKSMDDVDNYLAEIKNRFPEISPMVYGAWGFDYWQGMAGLNMGSDWQLQPDGTYIHKFMDPKFEAFVRKINEYYRNGYINTDTFALNNDERDAYLNTGKTAILSGGTQGFSYTYSQMLKQIEPDAEIMELGPVNDVTYYLGGLGWCGTFITNKCKNPEAAIKAMRFLLSPEGGRLSMWGREGIEYTLDEKGAPIFSEEWIDAQNDRVLFNSKYNTQFYFGASALIEGVGRIAHLVGTPYMDVYDNIRSRVSVEPWYTLAHPKDPDSDEYIIETKIRDLGVQQLVPLYMAPDENELTNMLKTFRDLAVAAGIDKLTAYMNESIPNAKTMYK
jgi:putative aldouronate transport system substrate-binding protein